MDENDRNLAALDQAEVKRLLASAEDRETPLHVRLDSYNAALRAVLVYLGFDLGDDNGATADSQ